MPWDTAIPDTNAANYIETEQTKIREYYTNFVLGQYTRSRTITRSQYVGMTQTAAVAKADSLATDTDNTEVKAIRANNANAWTVDYTRDTYDTWTQA